MSDRKNSPALQRIEALLDENSFVELGACVTGRSTDFTGDPEKKESDGVVTGHGLIDGRLVFVYSQDPDIFNGTVGEMHAKKIAGLYDMALKMGAPMIGILDSKGVRLTESVDVLEAVGTLINKAVKASGVIPEISVVFNAGGGLSVLSGISDFTFMPDKGSLFINSPDSIKGNNKEKNDTSSAEKQFAAGNCDFVGTEDEVFAKVRELITYLPDSSLSGIGYLEYTDDLNRASDVSGKTGDAAAFAKEISDGNNIFLTAAGAAKEVSCGLIRLNGRTVAFFGNNASEENGGLITPAGAEKIISLVKFSDAFDIPILSLMNVKGFEASLHTEKCLLKKLTRMSAALAESNVPKITLITGDALGTPYIFMNSKSLGADLLYALPDSDMGIMDPDSAAKVISGYGEIDIDKAREDYENTQYGIENALRRGVIDRLVNPVDVRKYLIAGFEMLYSKTTEVYKKHGTK